MNILHKKIDSTDSSRNVLVVMISMPTEVFLEDLQQAFLSYHLKQAEIYRFKTSSNDFFHALKELEGNFIVTEKAKDKTIIRLHNPSIRDFLRDYLANHEQLLRTLVQAAIYFDQHMSLWEFREEQSGSLKFRKILVKYHEEFVHTLFTSINFRTCRLINHQISKGNMYKDVWEMSFEAKAMLVVSVASVIKTALSLNLLKQVIAIINQRIIDNHISQLDDFVGFLKEVKNAEKILFSLSSDFLDRAKNYLVTDIDSLESIKCFCDFKKCFPEVITDDVVEGVKTRFIEYIKEDVVNSDYDDPDFYRDDAYKVEALAKQFEVDMTDEIETLEKRAEELEAAQAPDEESDNEDHSSRGNFEVLSIFLCKIFIGQFLKERQAFTHFSDRG